jgi:hypothetical protein
MNFIDLRKSNASFFAHGIFCPTRFAGAPAVSWHKAPRTERMKGLHMQLPFSLLRSKERVATAKMQSLADSW